MPIIRLKSTCTSLVIMTFLITLTNAYGVGTQGPIGLMGPAGIQGLKGPKGDVGPQGVKGDKGDKGATGSRGPVGLPQAGINVGDIQYWDGIQWQVLPAPKFTNNNCNVATLQYFKNAKAPSWQTSCTPINTQVYGLGDIGPAGGIVIHLTDNSGLHGLEVAPADLVDSRGNSNFAWGCYGKSIPSAKATVVGTGATNTTAIVNGCSEENTAAKMAKSYVNNGYADWFLPSKDELELMYSQKIVVAKSPNYIYWSSSDTGTSYAWGQNFSNGFQQFNLNKGNPFPVRVVRAF